MTSEDLLGIDKLFQEEIQNHNYLVEQSANLQGIFSKITVTAFSISDSISEMFELIQKKDFESARVIFEKTVYSVNALGESLINAAQTIQTKVQQNDD
jgi:hypothetical protein